MLLCLRLTMYLKCGEIGFAIEVLWTSDLQYSKKKPSIGVIDLKLA